MYFRLLSRVPNTCRIIEEMIAWPCPPLRVLGRPRTDPDSTFLSRSIDVCSTKYHSIHGGRLHPHLRHCSSAASAVRRLSSAVRTATPAFDVRSSGLFCSRFGGLGLVTRLGYLRDPSRSFDSFHRDLKTFLVLGY